MKTSRFNAGIIITWGDKRNKESFDRMEKMVDFLTRTKPAGVWVESESKKGKLRRT